MEGAIATALIGLTVAIIGVVAIWWGERQERAAGKSKRRP